MCNKYIFSSLSFFSAPYIICLCSIEVSDARLLMIPSDRNLYQNGWAVNENIKKVIFIRTNLVMG